MSSSRATVALVGVGPWGRNIFNALIEIQQAQLSHICDLAAMPEGIVSKIRNSETRYTDSFEEVLSDPRVRGVIIATPTKHHFTMTKMALESGKGVLVEKPISTNVAEARELCLLAKQKKLPLMVGHVFLYSPACRLIREIIISGEIGEVIHISFIRSNLGPFRADVSALWDLAPHDVSLAHFWLNENLQEVSATLGSFYTNSPGDVGSIFLKYKSGRAVSIYVSWINPIKNREVVIVGRKKAILWDDTRLEDPVRIFDSRVQTQTEPTNFLDFKLSKFQGDVHIPRVPLVSPLKAELESFIGCLCDKKTPLPYGEDGLRVVEVLEAAEHSINQGKTVDLICTYPS